MSTPIIIVIGNANVDLTTYLSRIPGPGETVLGRDFSIGMGGKGANQAVAAARAGGDAAFIGRVGDDDFGNLMLSTLGKETLNLSALRKISGPSGVASILVDDTGENRIAVFAGASASLTASDAVGHLEEFSGARFVVSQLEIDQTVIAATFVAARHHNMVTILNTAPYAEILPQIMENTSWLIANEGEMSALLTDRGIDHSRDMSPADIEANLPQWSNELGCSVIVTLGPKGALGCHEGVVSHATAPPVKAVDTVGAGDCFVGFFAVDLERGATWQEAMSSAVLAASESVTKPGAQSSYPKPPVGS